jgi:uncharacterized protein YcnI
MKRSSVISRPEARRFTGIVAAAIFVIALPALVFAHAVVYPKASTPGAYERYTLRVPNEKNVPTTRIELRFSRDVRVSSFADVPGWRLQVITDSAGAVTGAVWTGTLPPKRFAELPFVAVNPKTPGTISWPTIQTYADGQVVEWTGVEGSKTPASSTQIAAVSASTGGSSADSTRWVAWVALIIAIFGLGIAIRRPSVG